MKDLRFVPLMAAVAVLGGFFPAIARAELVKRNMYVDSAGKTVSQYVYQGGRTRSSRGSTGFYGYGYGFSPFYSGYYRSGTYLSVRPHVYTRGYSRPSHGHGHGQVRGIISGGRAQVRIRR